MPVQEKLFNGLLAGLLATVPMTLWMLSANRWLPARKPDPLPPEEVTRQATQRVNVAPVLSGRQKQGMTLVAHFSYGAAAGVPLGWLVRGRRAGPAVARGIGYGLLVWGGSYMGLLPALKLYPPAVCEPARMNTIMILAHVVWGGFGGFLARYLPVNLRARNPA